MSIRKQLAERLKFFRERSGLTIVEVGKSIGKSNKTISAWENERGQPDADMLMKLCELYRIESISELYGEPSAANISLSPDEVKLLDDYRSLNIQGQLFVRQTMVAALNTYKKHNSVSNMEASKL